jgi:chromosome segregation ATPase
MINTREDIEDELANLYEQRGDITCDIDDLERNLRAIDSKICKLEEERESLDIDDDAGLEDPMAREK